MHTIFIRGGGPRAEYELAVDGPLEHSDEASTQPIDEITATDGGHIVQGSVTGGTDAYRYQRRVRYVDVVGGDVTVDVRKANGEWVEGLDPEGYGSERPKDPEPEPEPEPSGGGYVVGEDDAPIMQIPDARNCDEKPLHTTAPIRLWVAPGGDDVATGAGDDPLASIDEASARLPLLWYHSVKIHVQPGSYESPHGGGLIVGPHMQGFFGPTREGFEIVGMGDSSEDVELNYRQANVNIWPNGSYQNARLRNLTINGTVSGYRGGFGVENCTISPTRSDGVAVAGYGNDVWLENVTFGDRTRDAVHVKEGSEVILNGCSGQVERRVVKGSHGTVRSVYGNDIDTPADSWLGEMNPNLPVSVVHGTVER